MKILTPFLPAALFGITAFALAEITAIGVEADRLEADQDATQNEPAKPKETPESGAGENQRDELDQLLGETENERLAFSSDKKLLAHLGERLVTVWSVEDGRRLHQLILEGRPLSAAFSHDSGSVVTADGVGNLEYLSSIRLWSLATGEGRTVAQCLGSPIHFSFNPDGSRLATSTSLGFIGSISESAGDGNAKDRIQKGGAIYVWRVSDGRELLKVDIELPGYSAELMKYRRAQADDPDFNQDKAAGNALQAAYYEAVLKRMPKRLEFSPDGKRLISVWESGEETIFDYTTEKPLRPTSRGEQDDTEQPATVPELKSEG